MKALPNEENKDDDETCEDDVKEMVMRRVFASNWHKLVGQDHVAQAAFVDHASNGIATS